MSLRLNKTASFLKKEGFFVFYYDYNFYFFNNETAGWIESIIGGKEEGIPASFIAYLKEKRLAYGD